MKTVFRTVGYGKTDIAYELVTTDRKSLEIAVHPDKSVVVKAPAHATPEAVEGKVRKRAGWIRRQIAYFDQFDPRTPERKYVGGESHLYLGRKYRLKIEVAERDGVSLKNGYFRIATISDRPDHIKRLMDAWYRRRAEEVLPKVFEDCWESFKQGGPVKPHLKLRRMDRRWGSLSRKGNVTLNSNLIRTPKECMEYVVVHELCHLVHHDHGTGFYGLLDRTMPDWKRRKHKLETALI